jgi:hypothetical protein
MPRLDISVQADMRSGSRNRPACTSPGHAGDRGFLLFVGTAEAVSGPSYREAVNRRTRPSYHRASIRDPHAHATCSDREAPSASDRGEP